MEHDELTPDEEADIAAAIALRHRRATLGPSYYQTDTNRPRTPQGKTPPAPRRNQPGVCVTCGAATSRKQYPRCLACGIAHRDRKLKAAS